jgi:gamma-glutamyl:cysteine ligase YbdK (ATP-grasp superfamily)
MDQTPVRLHLFQAFGVELEYMIVDRDTLDVRPITDELLKHVLGSYASDYENGMVTWSNELVLHVVELKSSKPELNLNALEHAFVDNVRHINAVLATSNAMLMPTAAHPFMDPFTQTKLWPHDNNAVYEIYNKIFDCKGHGWANLQSTHINLPFYDDEEFAKLHAAIRVILPLLPALCASSPILDGNLTGIHDTRLQFYKSNQSKLPSITGKVIPEAIFSKRNYHNQIYEKIKADITPYDPEGELNPVWVNSRGAIPRFDRGSIEIRLIDIQECPSADIAIVSYVTELVKFIVNGFFIDFDSQIKIRTEMLAQMLDRTIVDAQDAILDKSYCEIFGLPEQVNARTLCRHIFEKLAMNGNKLQHSRNEIDIILSQGTLSKRIVTALNGDPTKENIMRVYKQLSGCLAQNKMFIA